MSSVKFKTWNHSMKKIIYILLLLPGVVMAGQFKALLFTKTAGWHHQSINAGVEAVKQLAQTHHIELDWQVDGRFFNDQYLQNIDLVIFLNTTGDVLNAEQKTAFQKFIQAGKGFVGVHSASDTEANWPWYGQLVGHYFKIHPEIQTAQLQIQNADFPGMYVFHDKQLWTDEWYEFYPANIKNLNYLLRVDETSYDIHAQWGELKATGMGEFHPIAWYHYFDGGRSFYTSLGHTEAIYKNQQFLTHLYGGIYWAATGKGIQ